MKYVGKWIGPLAAVLVIGVSSGAWAQDASPPPGNSAGSGSAPGEPTLGTVPEREDDAGTARDAPERDMLGTGAVDEPISGDGTGADSDTQERQAEGSRDRSATAADGDSTSRDRVEDPGLDEPRQPIRPGQMEQEVEGGRGDGGDIGRTDEATD